MDSTEADLHLGANLKNFQSDGVTLSSGKLSPLKSDLSQLIHNHIGERREIQSELISSHGGRGSAVGKQIQLLLLNPVFHLSSSAVDLFIELTGFYFLARDIGNQKTGIRSFGEIFRLANYSSSL